MAVLDYAFQLIQAPVAIFALSLATALFPTMSRHAAGSGRDELRDTTSLGLRGVLFTMMPVMAATFAASQLIVRVLFQRGMFEPAATQAVAGALVAFAVGTVPYAAYYIVTRTYYALHDMRTPVRVGVFMIVLNAAGNFVLMRSFGYLGISLCTSIVSTVNVGVLLWLLRGRLGRLGGREIALTGDPDRDRVRRARRGDAPHAAPRREGRQRGPSPGGPHTAGGRAPRRQRRLPGRLRRARRAGA